MNNYITGNGAWSAWSYRLIVENKNGTRLFDFNDIKVDQYTIPNLKPGTEYILKVAAYTFSGEGPWSDEFRGKTLHRNVSLLWSSNDGLLLSDITGYRVTKIEPINYLEVNIIISIIQILKMNTGALIIFYIAFASNVFLNYSSFFYLFSFIIA